LQGKRVVEVQRVDENGNVIAENEEVSEAK
jgi:hypothetical protein